MGDGIKESEGISQRTEDSGVMPRGKGVEGRGEVGKREKMGQW